MTPTELWDVYYHAMKKWLPGSNDKFIRLCVDELMELSGKFTILFTKRTVESYYKNNSSGNTYIDGVDPEVTCWNCKRTFLCDCMDSTCRLCGAPYDRNRCEEFNFKV